MVVSKSSVASSTSNSSSSNSSSGTMVVRVVFLVVLVLVIVKAKLTTSHYQLTEHSILFELQTKIIVPSGDLQVRHCQ